MSFDVCFSFYVCVWRCSRKKQKLSESSLMSWKIDCHELDITGNAAHRDDISVSSAQRHMAWCRPTATATPYEFLRKCENALFAGFWVRLVRREGGRRGRERALNHQHLRCVFVSVNHHLSIYLSICYFEKSLRLISGFNKIHFYCAIYVLIYLRFSLYSYAV